MNEHVSYINDANLGISMDNENTEHRPDIVPQAMAGRVVGKDRAYVHTLLSRDHIRPVEVYGERWVSLTEIRVWMAKMEVLQCRNRGRKSHSKF